MPDFEGCATTVYVLPSSSCQTRGLRDSNTGCYYSNTNIKACLILKAPDDTVVPATHGARVQCNTAYDAHGAMVNLRMTTIADSERMIDNVDGSSFPRRFTATVAKPQSAEYISLHRMLEREREGAVYLSMHT